MDSYYDAGGVELEFGDFEVSVEELAAKDGRLYLTGYDYNDSKHFIAVLGGFENTDNAGLRQIAKDTALLQRAVAGERVPLSRDQFGTGISDALIQHCDVSLSQKIGDQPAPSGASRISVPEI